MISISTIAVPCGRLVISRFKGFRFCLLSALLHRAHNAYALGFHHCLDFHLKADISLSRSRFIQQMAPDNATSDGTPRRSSRLKNLSSEVGGKDESDKDAKVVSKTDTDPSSPRHTKKRVKHSKSEVDVEREDKDKESPVAEKDTPASKRRRRSGADNEKDASKDATPQENKKEKKKKAPPHQVLTEKDEIPRLWNPSKAPDGSCSTYSYDKVTI